MSLFRWNWLRSLVRNHSKPIEKNKAILWKQRLSIVYALLTWNAFGFVIYCMYNGKIKWSEVKGDQKEKLSIGEMWAKSSGATHGTLFKYKDGKFTKEEVTFRKDEDKNEPTKT